MLFIGYVNWVCYWAINSVVVRTVQTVYPDTLAGQTLGMMQ